jgi:hypothetical protein
MPDFEGIVLLAAIEGGTFKWGEPGNGFSLR